MSDNKKNRFDLANIKNSFAVGIAALSVTTFLGLGYYLWRSRKRSNEADHLKKLEEYWPMLLELSDDCRTKTERRTNEIIQQIRKDTLREPVNIVLMGCIGAGKSSLVNTLLSVFRSTGASQDLQTANRPDEHVTRTIRAVPLPETGVTMLDTIGWEKQNNEMNFAGLIEDLVLGKLSVGFSLDTLEQKLEDLSDQEGYKAELTLEERNHGAIIVVSVHELAQGLNSCADESITLRGRQLAPDICIALTKLDENWGIRLEEFGEYQHSQIVDSIHQARNTYPAPVFPIQNYRSDSVERDWRRNYLAVLLLKHAVDNALKFKEQCSQSPDGRKRQSDHLRRYM